MTMPPELAQPYQGYAYAYPHKSSYRSFEPPVSLHDAWRNEPSQRFLYVHVPFCEMRCGFCNLFTLVNPDEDITKAYLTTLTREAETVAQATGTTEPPVQMAIGGGTPTWLAPGELDQLFDLLNRCFMVDPRHCPTAIETSPKTATDDRLLVLKDRGVERVSIGVQSFDETEAKAMGRPQKTTDVEAALDRIRAIDFRALNLDLIYGAANQTPASFVASIKQAMKWEPEEVYLYPLYVRPRTGLDGRAEVWDTQRLTLYRHGRDTLLSQGYTQISMRHFRKGPDLGGEYTCQEDGMIGLGPGARSYTRDLHYAMDFAVSRAAILGVLQRYIAKDRSDFSRIDHGIRLTQIEKMRRYVLKSLLHQDGLNTARFEYLFNHRLDDTFPELSVLAGAGLLASGSVLKLTPAGLERSDAIGPWFYSSNITQKMEAFAPA
ncbi:MAG: STM4012 family radical SAM protein [Paracoccaceae bacterium]